MQINGIQYRSIFEHNTTLGISNALHIFLKQGPLFTVIHNMLWGASFSDSKKIIMWYKFLFLYLIRYFETFLGQILTHSSFKVLKVVWSFSLLRLHIRDAGGGPLKVEYVFTAVAVGGLFESILRTSYRFCWKPTWKQSSYLAYDLLQSIFRRKWETCMRETSRWGVVARQAPHSLPVKSTTGCNATGPSQNTLPAYLTGERVRAAPWQAKRKNGPL